MNIESISQTFSQGFRIAKRGYRAVVPQSIQQKTQEIAEAVIGRITPEYTSSTRIKNLVCYSMVTSVSVGLAWRGWSILNAENDENSYGLVQSVIGLSVLTVGFMGTFKFGKALHKEFSELRKEKIRHFAISQQDVEKKN